jgi:hypothetical protein
MHNDIRYHIDIGTYVPGAPNGAPNGVDYIWGSESENGCIRADTYPEDGFGPGPVAAKDLIFKFVYKNPHLIFNNYVKISIVMEQNIEPPESAFDEFVYHEDAYIFNCILNHEREVNS